MKFSKNETILLLVIVIFIVMVILMSCLKRSENLDVGQQSILQECIFKSQIIDDYKNLNSAYNNAQYDSESDENVKDVKKFVDNLVTCETNFFKEPTPLKQAQNDFNKCINKKLSLCN